MTLLDLTTTDASLKKFSAAFTDGTDGILPGTIEKLLKKRAPGLAVDGFLSGDE